MKTDTEVEADLDKLSERRGKTPEGAVKTGVKAILDAHGVWYMMPSKMIFGKSGIPDFICCAYGYFLAVETKAKKSKPTALQTIVLNTITKAGGKSLVINEHNLSELETWLKSKQNQR